jgi:predicted transcriptional regulator
MLGQLAQKGVLKLRRDGKRYLYRPATPIEKASRSALKSLLSTFFAGRPADAMAALLDVSAGRLTPEDIQRMRQLVDQAAKEDQP